MLFRLRPRLAIAEGHARPGLAEQKDGFRANAARPAGDERNFNIQGQTQRHRPTLKHCQRECRDVLQF